MKTKRPHIQRNSSGKYLTILIILLALFTYPLLAQESWPLSTDWRALLSADWGTFSDPQDVSQGYIDFIVDNDGNCGYYYATTTSLFFRLVLRVNPINKKGELTQNAWGVMIDVDKDNYLDWFVLVGGISDELWAYPNSVTVPDNVEDATPNWTILSPYEVAGYVTSSAASITAYPDACYLDVQVPFDQLQLGSFTKNISNNTTFKVVYGSNTSESLSNMADLTGTSSTLGDAFAAANVVNPSNPDTYGEVYDTRDTNPFSNEGIWYRGETVTVSGSGWPTFSSAYYNNGKHGIRIVNESSTVLWDSTMVTNMTGDVTNYSTWRIENYVLPGIYTIEVEDPRNPGTYNYYDSFEIQAPVISITKSVDATPVDPVDTVQYTITIVNDGNLSANLTSVVDDLPSGFIYLGPTSGLTTSGPTINGSQLTWPGSWSLSGPGSVSLVFSAVASLSPGPYTNRASVSGSNFETKSTGATAEVQINGAALFLNKSVDKSSVAPGDTISYTVSYSNPGNGNATYVFILENIQIDTDYISGSAQGANMTITYSHNNGVSYDSDETPPVTNLSFQLSGTLTPGSSGQIQYKVKVK